MSRLNLQLIHLGGEDCVTGSCHLLRANGLNILIDCGTVQGRDTVVPMEEWPVRPSEIRFLFLTHAHIDHIGRVPELIRKGFKGEIIATEPTRILLRPMLEDALRLGGRSRIQDAGSRMQDVGDGKNSEILDVIEELAWGFEYDQVFDLRNGIRFRLGRAGHVLGSCFIRLADEGEKWSVVFSGDLGARNTPILPDPEAPEGCDLLVLESTYGDANHEERLGRVRRLGDILSRSLEDGGKVLVPAFALGRTQELIYEMDRIFSGSTGFKAGKVPVFVDSPLALELTGIYSDLKGFWDEEAGGLLERGDDPLDFERLYGVRDFRSHQELMGMDGPAVIIAGSGMCTGGRILDHLKAGLDDPRNDVLFVGFQAQGTLGREIVRCGRNGGGSVPVEGEQVVVRAKIRVLPGYSAHADQSGLVDWVASAHGKIGAIKLVHGEPRARESLERELKNRLSADYTRRR